MSLHLKKRSGIVLAAALGVAGVLPALGSDAVGTTSAPFTKLGAGARASALGDAYVALSDDAAGVAFNPAGMSQMLSGQVQATHTEWFQSLRYENLTGVFSVGDGGMVGVNFSMLLAPQITRTQQTGNDPDNPDNNYKGTGTFSPYDWLGALSYSRPLVPGLLGGASLKFLGQNIDETSAFGVGVDVGLLYNSSIDGLKGGFSVQNLGTPIKFKKEGFLLPTVIRLGASYALLEKRLAVPFEVDLPIDTSPVMALGAEYNLSDTFFPRAGYRLELGDAISNRSWSLGLGIKWQQLGFDFSAVPFSELGMTYRGTLSYSFGQPSAGIRSPFPYLSSAKQGAGAVIRLDCVAPDKVTAWGLYIYNSVAKPQVVRTFTGKGGPAPNILWDGRDAKGLPVPEGIYHAVMSIRYATGQVVVSPYLRLQVDNQPPKADLSVEAGSRGAGEDLFVPARFIPKGTPGRVPARWKMEVIGPDDRVFRTFEGEETPPEVVVWDGRGDKGEAYVSGQVYRFRLTIVDKLGNASEPAAPLSFRCVFRQ